MGILLLLFLIFIVLPAGLIIAGIVAAAGSVQRSRSDRAEYEKRAEREMSITGETRAEWDARIHDQTIERWRARSAARREAEMEAKLKAEDELRKQIEETKRQTERNNMRIRDEFYAYKAKRSGQP
jgi:hypothetical protein